MKMIPLDGGAFLIRYSDHSSGAPVIELPGGGYHVIAPGEGVPIAEIYTREGFDPYILHYSVFESSGSADFDMNKADPFAFTPLHDLSEAMDVVSSHCEGEKIILAGFSAGAHLAFYYSLFAKSPRKKASHLVLCYPAIWYQGFDKNDVSDLLESVSADFPPLFFVHGLNDQMVNPTSSLWLAETLQSLNLPFESHFFSDMPHAQPLYNDDWMNLAVEWIRRT